MPRLRSGRLPRGRPLALLAAAALLAPVGDRAEGLDSPPVLLRKAPVSTPDGAAGTGLAPEVKVRVTVGPQGRVEEVKVVAIEPSSEHDGLFREAAAEALRHWRYAPAREGGEPVARTLEWSIQFLPKPFVRAPEPSRFYLHLGRLVDEEASRATVFTLTPERQAELLMRQADAAERYLGSGARHRADTPRFVVISDAPDAETAEVVAGNLEVIFEVLEEVLRPAVEPYPDHYKLVVYLFARRDSLTGLASSVTVAEWAGGFYLAPGLVASHLEVPTVDRLLRGLIHETVHAYVDRHLMRPGYHLPTWLNEGLAEYFAQSEIQRGRLLPGRIRKGELEFHPRRDRVVRRETEAAWSLDRVKGVVRRGEALSVAELLAADPETFYGGDEEETSLRYALSWLFVHFLRHGAPGWAEREFASLLLYAAEGYPAETVLAAVYGLSPAELEEPFRAYVRAL